jgi:hypothetical protein
MQAIFRRTSGLRAHASVLRIWHAALGLRSILSLAERPWNHDVTARLAEGDGFQISPRFPHASARAKPSLRIDSGQAAPPQPGYSSMMTASPRMARRVRLAAAALVLLGPTSAYAAGATVPRPPCRDGDPLPAYGEVNDPAIESWSKLEWAAPACLAWSDSRYRFVIAVAGRMEAPNAAAVLSRLGAVSTTRGLLYWSVTEGAWRVLIKDAAALSGPQGDRRDDFAPAELREGGTFYFVEEDNRSEEPVTYAMHVLESKPGRILVETENVTPIKALLATVFPPGTLRTAYIMTRIDSHTWGFYEISAATERASGLVSLGKTSYENRARAFFAHFAGVEMAHDKPPR